MRVSDPRDLPSPTVLDAELLPETPLTSDRTAGRLHRLTPKQLLYFYTPEQWEAFIREWATTVDTYKTLKILAGPGDKGIDVAGLITDAGLLGTWDCFQCKHYEAPLMPSDAYPEMAKMLRHVDAGHYVLPRRYVFLAPRGCGPTLSAELSNATELKRSFLAFIDKAEEKGRLAPDAVQAVRRQADKANFELFNGLPVEDVLDAHSRTRFYIERFDQPLPDRPPIEVPRAFVPSQESRYAAKLIDVYLEVDQDCGITEETASSHPKWGDHMRRQRQAFFSAEALREFARDKVLPGTFERLLEDVHAGVIDLVESPHETGIARLRAVLTHAGAIDLTAHRLVAVTRVADRHGMCHQLAGADRLDWVRR